MVVSSYLVSLVLKFKVLLFLSDEGLLWGKGLLSPCISTFLAIFFSLLALGPAWLIPVNISCVPVPMSLSTVPPVEGRGGEKPTFPSRIPNFNSEITNSTFFLVYFLSLVFPLYNGWVPRDLWEYKWSKFCNSSPKKYEVHMWRFYFDSVNDRLSTSGIFF